MLRPHPMTQIRLLAARTFLFLVLALLALLGWPTLVHAATLTITSTADDGSAGTLRSEIAAASPGDTITFDPVVFAANQTITLLQGTLTISQSLTINGPAVGVAVDGNQQSSVFVVTGGTMSSPIILSGLTIQNGSAASGGNGSASSGGGLYNSGGYLVITNCAFTGNNTAHYGFGGGLSNSGTAIITDCTFSANTAFAGGGIFNTGTATLTHCSFTNNIATNGGGALSEGGGLDNRSGGVIVLTDCTLTGNQTPLGDGGGLGNTDGTATLTNCVVTDNSAGDSFGGGFGGGIFSRSFSPGSASVTMTNCTVAGNSSSNSGGGLFNLAYTYVPVSQSTVSLTNDIFSGDSAPNGPEIYNNGGTVITSASDIRQGGYAGTNGNISADPEFVNHASDVHLQPLSPCIGMGTAAGAPATDADANPRPSPPSMGAYEFEATPGYSLVVNTPTDEDNGTPSPAFGTGTSLREAINFANKYPGATITFDPMLGYQSIMLTHGTLSVDRSLTIIALPIGLTIDGNQASPDFTITGGSSASPVTLVGLTIRNGRADYGGGIVNLNTATLVLTNCDLIANYANIGGGGLYNEGTATLTNCTLVGNAAAAGGPSGSGGGLYNAMGMVMLTNCSLSSNSAYLGGGGLVNYATVVLTNDILYHDGGGEVAGAGVMATYCDIQGGYAGASNINADPLFQQAGSANLRLQLNSPCFGAGTSSGAPATDHDGNPRPDPPSIGAFDVPLIVTRTLLVSYGNPSRLGQTVTFVASVTGTGATPTGTVTFSLDGIAQPPVALTGGQAVFETAGLLAGSHQVVAFYSGDVVCRASQSAVLTQTIGPAVSTTALLSSLNPSVFGQSVTLTATVTGNSPTGTVTFLDGTTTIGTGVLAGGVAMVSTSALVAGGHSLTAAYGGDANNSAGTSSALTQQVSAPPVSHPDAYSVTENQGLTVTAANGVLANDTDPQGSALTASLVGQAAHGLITLNSNGSFTDTPTTGYFGPDAFTYAATDAAGLTSGPATVTLAVAQASATHFQVTAPAIATLGSPFLVTVNAQNAYGETVTSYGGTAHFTSTDGQAVLPADAPLAGGVGAFSVTLATPAAQSVTATDAANSLAGSASVSVSLNPTATKVSSSLNPSAFGQSVTLTATVTGDRPTGIVTFLDGTSVLGTGTLSGGTATLTTSALAAGGHSLTAAYGGDANNSAGTSTTLTQTVSPAVTTLAVASASGTTGQAITLSATLTSAGSPVTGEVITFSVDGTSVGTATTSGGTAYLSYTIPNTSTAGRHTLSAVFTGDTNYGASAGTGTLTVDPAALTVANASGSAGQAITLSATLKAASGAALSGKALAFSVDGTTVGTGVTNSSGTATKSYVVPVATALAVGSHTLTAAFAGDSAAASSSGVGALSIVSAPTNLSVSGVSGTPGQTVTLKAMLRRTTGGLALGGETVIFSLDGSPLGSAITNSSGAASVNYSVPSEEAIGVHPLAASFVGDGSFGASAGGGTLTALKFGVTLLVPAASGLPGQALTLSATLKRSTGGLLLAGQTVSFTVDGASVGTAMTNASGVANLPYTVAVGAAAGSHAVTVSFAGDPSDSSGTGKGTLTVKAATALAVAAVSGIHGTTVTLSATLTRASDGSGLSGKSVTFLVDGKSLGSAATNASGTASHTYTIPMTDTLGSHALTMTFAGDTGDGAVSGAGTLTVS